GPLPRRGRDPRSALVEEADVAGGGRARLGGGLVDRGGQMNERGEILLGAPSQRFPAPPRPPRARAAARRREGPPRPGGGERRGGGRGGRPSRARPRGSGARRR